MASKVYFADLRADMHENLQQKLTRLMKTAGMGDIDFQDKFVAIKLHFGEPGNLAFLRPNWARTVADFVKERGGKPFLTDCNTLYVGGRKNALDHMDSAMLNGFNPMTTGCQIIIADGLKGSDEVEVPVAGGEYVKNAKIGRAVMDADVFISLTHFKGHETAGFGGCLKNIGMGLANFIPLPLSAITMILNVVLLLIGFVTCGREFGVKTVYTSVMLPIFLGLFEILFPNFGSLTDSQELDVLCYILVVSVGLSILFNRNASSGGLDIVAKIMNKYLHMELGKAMSLSGMCVALSAALVYDKKTVVLSILGTYFNGIILDHFIFDNNIKRRVCIITKKEEELRQFITRDLHSGATIYEATGAYHFEKHNEIITIVDKSEYQKLMKFINELDPKAFITVYNVSSMKYQPKTGAF